MSTKQPELTVTRRTVASLIPYALNSKDHPEAQVVALAGFIHEIGFRQPIAVDDDGVIIAGHGRLLAAQRLGMTEVPVIVHAGLTDREKRAMRIADNRLAELATSNDGNLAAELADLAAAGQDLALVGYSQADLDALTRAGASSDLDADAEPEIDKAEEMRKKWEVEPGQLWELGEHRLLCGSSVSSSDVSKIIGLSTADMMWTDPPYGVSYVGKTKSALTIQNDGKDDLGPLLSGAFECANAVLKDGAAIYVAHPAGAQSVVFGVSFLDAGWRLHETLIWVKDSMVLGHSDYHYKHEPILYGYKAGGGRRGRGGFGWFGDNAQTSVFEVPRPSRSEEHPTMKPVALVEIMIRNSSDRGHIVYEPFSGSGTTLIACERLGRRCRAIEISPGYVAVSLQRFEDATGKKPTLIGTGPES